MNNINVLISVNKKFLQYAEELIFSILHYSSKPINIYLMYVETELGLEDLEGLKKFVNKTGNGQVIPIKFYPQSLEGMPLTDNEGAFFGFESYSRLFCAFYLPKEVDRILYLDVDMVCSGDITELYNLDFEGKTWIACADEGIRPCDLERLNLPLDCKYINSGMLLINLEKIRGNYTEQEILQLIYDNHEVFIYPDQDFINMIFKDDIKIANSKYNVMAKDVKYSELEEEPVIIHYAGKVKPWYDDVSDFEIECMKPYYESMRLQGEYKKEKLEKLLLAHKKNGYRSYDKNMEEELIR